MKNRIISSLVILMIVVSSLTLISCRKDDSADDRPESAGLKQQMRPANNDFDDPSLDNEIEGAEITPVDHDEMDFVGSWYAPSDKAEYLYGNVNLKINEDHTWSGNITEEKFQGRWRAGGTGILIQDSNHLINWQLFFDADGTMMFNEVRDPEICLVLKRVSGGK